MNHTTLPVATMLFAASCLCLVSNDTCMERCQLSTVSAMLAFRCRLQLFLSCQDLQICFRGLPILRFRSTWASVWSQARLALYGNCACRALDQIFAKLDFCEQ